MDRPLVPLEAAYVTREGDAERAACSATRSRGRASRLIVFRGATCFVILNLFPYNNGHLMVVPNRHIASLAEATRDELCELIELTRRAEVGARRSLRAARLNMGINLGKPAGAGVLDHLHMHVVPRWNGDTNFMTVVGETRVLPEELPQTAEQLRPIFERFGEQLRIADDTRIAQRCDD